ncbi:uncharacterized protein LOC106532290, partial [Austrofundulus limnaeus]|uniref:Uncharacterized protein LOC106532290 n=1 Tax=Austrofundulus limnaeus TaxID=52670 RepID=A0A2I4CUV4_AUSLI
MASASGGNSGGEMEWEMARSSRMKRNIRKRQERARSWSEESESREDISKKTKINTSPRKQTQEVQTNKEVEWKVMIEFKQEGGQFHPIKLTKAIEKEIGRIKLAGLMNNKKILIHAENRQQQEKIVKMTTLVGETIKAYIPGTLAKLKGVISGVPLDITIDEIKGGKITEATRIKNKRDGTLKDTMSVILQFENVMPESIQIGYVNFKVRTYIPNPLRCFICQRMGHVAKECKGKIRCARCSGPHEYGKCEKDSKVKCCNCGGEHSAAYGGCIVQKEAREAQRVKITEKISYAEAIKKVRYEDTKYMRTGEIKQRTAGTNPNGTQSRQKQP